MSGSNQILISKILTLSLKGLINLSSILYISYSSFTITMYYWGNVTKYKLKLSGSIKLSHYKIIIREYYKLYIKLITTTRQYNTLYVNIFVLFSSQANGVVLVSRDMRQTRRNPSNPKDLCQDCLGGTCTQSYSSGFSITSRNPSNPEDWCQDS